MEVRDSVSEKETGLPAGQPGTLARAPIDRVELKHQWEQQAEEQQAEATLNLYAQAARRRMSSGVQELPDGAESEEEREVRSQQLRLQQKCQDIAALIFADELEETLDEE